MEKTENIFSDKELPGINYRIKRLVDYYAKGSVKRFSEMAGLASSQKLNRIFNIDKRNGEYPEASSDIIIAIANMFPLVNKDWLLTGNEPMILESNINYNNQCEYKADYNKEYSCVSSSEAIYKKKISHVPIVDILAAAGNGGYDNQTFIDVIDRISLPSSMINDNAKYICVKIKGESMSPTLLDSSFIIIRLIDRGEWEEIPDQHIYVISDKEGKAYIKRLKNRLTKHGFVVCTSDNPDKICYPNFNLSIEEINSIWHAEWYFSAKMPNIHDTYYNKIEEMGDDIDLLKEQLSKLIRNLNK